MPRLRIPLATSSLPSRRRDEERHWHHCHSFCKLPTIVHRPALSVLAIHPAKIAGAGAVVDAVVGDVAEHVWWESAAAVEWENEGWVVAVVVAVGVDSGVGVDVDVDSDIDAVDAVETDEVDFVFEMIVVVMLKKRM